MTAIVNVTVATDGATTVTAKAGTVLAGMSIALSNGAPAQLVTATPYAASFSDVAPGTYTATATFVDANGNALGPAVASASVTVEADVSIDVPNIVSVSLAVQ